jgi:hypothetical protein
VSRLERYDDANQHKPFTKKGKPLFILIFIAILGVIFYFYSQTWINVEKPKRELGDKVIITMPSGKNIYTYENLIVEKEGKLLYKGERNTLDLTGGEIVYENWE